MNPSPLSRLALSAALLSLSLLPAFSAELGMKAPELKLAEVVQGEPVKLSDGLGKQVYVVEFWATWCGPCRTTIPHLTELQERFKDRNVTIIGISDETSKEVVPFMKKMGDEMVYTVALDDNRATYRNYMGAFGQNGIPTAFVVDRAGKIVWYGHPMAELDEVLEQVVAGDFDMVKFAERKKQREQLGAKLRDYFNGVVGDSYSDTTKTLGAEFAKECDDSEMLNHFAWTILTHEAVKHRDRDLALNAAKKAYGLTGGKDASVTDTYARALFDTGNKADAIKYQKEAIATAKDPDMKEFLEDNLKEFQSK